MVNKLCLFSLLTSARALNALILLSGIIVIQSSTGTNFKSASTAQIVLGDVKQLGDEALDFRSIKLGCWIGVCKVDRRKFTIQIFEFLLEEERLVMNIGGKRESKSVPFPIQQPIPGRFPFHEAILLHV